VHKNAGSEVNEETAITLTARIAMLKRNNFFAVIRHSYGSSQKELRPALRSG
jgi:hypothetical protein